MTTQKTLDPKKLRNDPVYFIQKVIADQQGYELTDYQKEWLRLVEEKKRVCFMAFRTSGKTSQLFVNYFIWRAFTRPHTKYAVVSRTLSQAREVLKDIRTTIQTNPLLKSEIPSNKSQAWSASEIELKNHSRILAKPANENVRGLHLDGVGCDELGEWEDHDVLTKAVKPIIRAKRGFFIGAGTPKSEMDLLHTIEADDESIYFDRYPAKGEKGNLFQERYPYAKVEERDGVYHIVEKDSGETIETYDGMSWSQEFMLRPVSMKDKLFPEHLILDCIDKGLVFEDDIKNMRQYFMGVDFALSAQSGSDFTVVTILEKRPGLNKLRIVNIERFRGMDYTVQKERIQELAEKYKIVKALGDENSFGKTFIYDLKREGVPIEGYRFSAKSGSKEELIKTLRDQFERKGFEIPYGSDKRTRMIIDTLTDELNKFGIVFNSKKNVVQFEGTGKHDDMVISLGLANFIARHVSMASFKVMKSSKRRKQSNNPFAIK